MRGKPIQAVSCLPMRGTRNTGYLKCSPFGLGGQALPPSDGLAPGAPLNRSCCHASSVRSPVLEILQEPPSLAVTEEDRTEQDPRKPWTTCTCLLRPATSNAPLSVCLSVSQPQGASAAVPVLMTKMKPPGWPPKAHQRDGAAQAFHG